MSWGRLATTNYRGAIVPRVIGPGLAACALGGCLAYEAFGSSSARPEWVALGAALLVFAAGLVDDLVPGEQRGIRGHLRELLSGRMTTGGLKALVATASGVVVVARFDRGGGLARIGAVILIAGTTNVWNGLDVRPGRALKAFALAAAPLVFLDGGLWVARSLWAGAVVALPWDLREKAMLGDSGSNLLGFVLGTQLAVSLPTWAMWPGAVIAVLLNVVAESVTFSRVIDGVPLLRWFDRLGAQRT